MCFYFVFCSVHRMTWLTENNRSNGFIIVCVNVCVCMHVHICLPCMHNGWLSTCVMYVIHRGCMHECT